MLKKIVEFVSRRLSVINFTKIYGNNNCVVNITALEGATRTLTLQKTRWNTEPQPGGGVVALLEWRTRLAPLIGREAELASLKTWLNGDAELSFMVLHADGGSGKTRLAAEFADKCTGWQHGWVDLRDFTQADALVWQGRNLLLVDYAEHQPDQLAQLARAAQRANPQGGSKLRVLLVVRELNPVRDVLQKNSCGGYMAAPLKLGDLTREQDFQVLQAALGKLKQLGKYSGAAGHVTAVRFKDWQLTNPVHRNPLFVTALAIDLANESTEPANLPKRDWLTGSDLLQSLVKRECHRWELAEKGHSAPLGAIETVVVWATLSNGITAAQLNDDLMPAYSWTSEQQRCLHQALAAAWPSQNYQIPSLAPDLLAAQFLTHWRRNTAVQGLAKRDAALAEKLWQISDEASFQRRFERLHMVAYDQAVRIGSCTLDSEKALQHWLISLVAVSPNVSKALATALTGYKWIAFRKLTIGILKFRLERQRAKLPEVEIAGLFYDLSINLLADGEPAGALTAAQEAATIRCWLAVNNPAAHEASLAASLNNLSTCKHGQGDYEGALAPAQKAVEIYRRLASSAPAVHVPNLAKCLNNLAIRLRDLKDLKSALAIAREAVDMYRSLATDNRAAYQFDLAMSLHNLANWLGDLDDCEGALNMQKEAVDIYRAMVRRDPATCESDLAISLSSMAICMSAHGDCKDALDPSQEGIDICRRLVAANPEAFKPKLAKVLGSAMVCFATAGKNEKAQAFGEEALALFTALAALQPEAFESYKNFTRAKLQTLSKS